MTLWGEKPTPITGLDASDFTYKYYLGTQMDPWLEKVQAELERLEALKLWTDAHYVKSGRSRGVQMLFDLVEGREGWRVCANCGAYTENYCIIEKGPPEENWIEDVWVKMGMLGKPICGECYYQ